MVPLNISATLNLALNGACVLSPSNDVAEESHIFRPYLTSQYLTHAGLLS